VHEAVATGKSGYVDIETGAGKVRGRRQRGVSTFSAVPYAAAPVGPRRFQPPEPLKPWAGVRDATGPVVVCPQSPSRLRFAMGDFTAVHDEDCLRVTVWTPAADAARRPVLIWLHGGAYMSGGGALDWYSGETLAREGDLVVVGVNYRIGALGFLYHPDLCSGNLGLLDQQAALAWVHANIAAFGGDPDRITVCGQSAGAQSTLFLLMQPKSRALFRRAILQSTPFGHLPREPDEMAANAEALMRELGVEPSAAREKLSALPVDALLAAQSMIAQKVAKDTQRGGLPMPAFTPLGDGNVVPSREHYQAALDDVARRADILIGTTREEMAVFFASNPAVQEMQRPPLPQDEIDRLKARRPGGSASELFADHVGAKVFVEGSLAFAERAATAGRRAFVYQFDWQSPDRRLHSCHCLELPFVFGTRVAFADAPMLANADAHQIDALSAVMRAAWIAFVRDGNPNVRAVPPWPAFDAQRRAVMHFDEICGASGAA
jgi:para-nitrobenzyl esterase